MNEPFLNDPLGRVGWLGQRVVWNWWYQRWSGISSERWRGKKPGCVGAWQGLCFHFLDCVFADLWNPFIVFGIFNLQIFRQMDIEVPFYYCFPCSLKITRMQAVGWMEVCAMSLLIWKKSLLLVEQYITTRVCPLFERCCVSWVNEDTCQLHAIVYSSWSTRIGSCTDLYSVFSFISQLFFFWQMQTCCWKRQRMSPLIGTLLFYLATR